MLPLSSLLGPVVQQQQPPPGAVNRREINFHGRRYIELDGQPLIHPCDPIEGERQYFFDQLVYHALHRKLHLAGLELSSPGKRIRVLDVGCGCGEWLMAMSFDDRRADLVGIDINHVDDFYPKETPKQRFPNVDFRSPVDFEKDEWGLQLGSFHFIRMSQLCGSVSNREKLLTNACRHARPGGFIELVEIDWTPCCDDGSLPADAAIHTWWSQMQEATRRTNKPIALPANMDQMLERAGFIFEDHKVIRVQTWGDERSGATVDKLYELYVTAMGDSAQTGDPSNVMRSFRGMTLLLFTSKLGWEREKVMQLCDDVANLVRKKNYRFYHKLHVWKARKPEAP